MAHHPSQIFEVKHYPPWYTFGPHHHANIEINFVRQGRCYLKLDQEVVAYDKDDKSGKNRFTIHFRLSN